MRKVGAGDIASKAIKVVSAGKIKECGKCRKRREAMNKLKIKIPGKGAKG